MKEIMKEPKYSPWIQLADGTAFFLTEPTADSIVIEDIAGALGKLCRYTGHVRKFYCPTPDQRVLTADLRWIQAGDLTVGQPLLGFDEALVEPGGAGKLRRRYRPSTVSTIVPVKRRVVRLVFEDGSFVKSSAEHPWLVATKTSRNQKWETAEEVKAAVDAGRRRNMHRFVPTWYPDVSRSAGWLAGIADGEGCLSIVSRRGTQLGIAQKPGGVLDCICSELKNKGFPFGLSRAGNSGVLSAQLRGGVVSVLRFLGEIRPVRLLATFQTGLASGEFAKQLDGHGSPLQVVSAYDEGESWVVGLSTTTRTYFCEGFAAHNSVAQHSVMVSRLVPSDLALTGLMHDATEAYIGDISRPLKQLLSPTIKNIEQTIWEVIAKKFGMPAVLPDEVKTADNIALLVERRDLMATSKIPWGSWADGYTLPKAHIVRTWSPDEASLRFMQQFAKLTGGKHV